MEIKIDKETLESAVTQAIVESSIGDMIKTAIRERLSDYKLKDAIGKVIDTQIALIVRDLLWQDENRETVKQAVQAQITDDVLREVVGKALEKIWQ